MDFISGSTEQEEVFCEFCKASNAIPKGEIKRK